MEMGVNNNAIVSWREGSDGSLWSFEWWYETN